MAANLIMTYQGKRFFPSVTPAILKIWTDTAEFGTFHLFRFCFAVHSATQRHMINVHTNTSKIIYMPMLQRALRLTSVWKLLK